MATHLGREGTIKVALTRVVGELRNYSLSHSSDVVEDSTLNDTYRTKKATLQTWTMSADVYWDETDEGQVRLTPGSGVLIDLYPEGFASSAVYYGGFGVVTKFDISGTFDGMVEGSITVEGTGILSTLTV